MQHRDTQKSQFPNCAAPREGSFRKQEGQGLHTRLYIHFDGVLEAFPNLSSSGGKCSNVLPDGNSKSGADSLLLSKVLVFDSPGLFYGRWRDGSGLGMTACALRNDNRVVMNSPSHTQINLGEAQANRSAPVLCGSGTVLDTAYDPHRTGVACRKKPEARIRASGLVGKAGRADVAGHEPLQPAIAATSTRTAPVFWDNAEDNLGYTYPQPGVS